MPHKKKYTSYAHFHQTLVKLTEVVVASELVVASVVVIVVVVAPVVLAMVVVEVGHTSEQIELISINIYKDNLLTNNEIRTRQDI